LSRRRSLMMLHLIRNNLLAFAQTIAPPTRLSNQ
jgi:hypothetical protein